MRSISGLYFLLRPAVFLLFMVPRLLNEYFNIKNVNKWFINGTFFCTLSLFIAFAKPYKKCYMNFTDALLLFYLAILTFVFSTTWRNNTTLFLMRMLLSTPIILFLLAITFQKIHTATVKLYKMCRNHLKLPCTLWFGGTDFTAETMDDQSVLVGSQMAAQPLIQPTSTVICYGTEDA